MEALSEQFVDVETCKPGSSPDRGSETHRSLWTGSAHDHPGAIRWRIDRRRTERAADVMREISGHVGGQQTFLGRPLRSPTTFIAISS